MLFGQLRHNFELEARLVQRLLEGGADINHRTRQGDTSITQLQNLSTADDDEMIPVYAVLLDWPKLDLTLPDAPSRPDGRTIRESVLGPSGYVHSKLREMIEQRGL